MPIPFKSAPCPVSVLQLSKMNRPKLPQRGKFFWRRSLIAKLKGRRCDNYSWRKS